MEHANRKLYRSRTQRILGGVCSGIAEYFNVDPVLIRLGWLVFTLMGGAGILGYIIALIIIPEAPYEPDAQNVHPPASPTDFTRLAGFILIIFGALFLIRQFGFHFNFMHLPWPVFLALGLIALGVYILLHKNEDAVRQDGEALMDVPDQSFVRIAKGKMLSGVCTGLARYFDVDVTIIRLLWVIATLATAGTGILAYIIAVIVFPVVNDVPENDFSGKDES